MVEGAQRVAWNHTAALLATVGSLFAKKPLRPADLHPYLAADRKPRRKPSEAETEAEARLGWAALKQAITGGKVQGG